MLVRLVEAGQLARQAGRGFHSYEAQLGDEGNRRAVDKA
jgi:3-hydroxyacyl-CoA dehydrogenase